jgi:hypothetical protein
VRDAELCDDGPSLNGCKNDCTGANADFTCSGGSPTSASVCSCIRANSSPSPDSSGSTCVCNNGYTLVSGECVVSLSCGDGKVTGIEICDDGVVS